MYATIREVVDMLGGAVSYGTVRRLATSGAVRATRIMGRILIERDALDDYLREQSYKVIAPAAKRGRPKKGR